jgi:hypothetical protein
VLSRPRSTGRAEGVLAGGGGDWAGDHALGRGDSRRTGWAVASGVTLATGVALGEAFGVDWGVVVMVTVRPLKNR